MYGHSCNENTACLGCGIYTKNTNDSNEYYCTKHVQQFDKNTITRTSYTFWS